MTLMRFDPFREFDRIMEQNFASGARLPRSMPMTARRRGDTFLVELDMPGVSMDDVELTVERNVVTIRARRSRIDRTATKCSSTSGRTGSTHASSSSATTSIRTD